MEIRSWYHCSWNDKNFCFMIIHVPKIKSLLWLQTFFRHICRFLPLPLTLALHFCLVIFFIIFIFKKYQKKFKRVQATLFICFYFIETPKMRKIRPQKKQSITYDVLERSRSTTKIIKRPELLFQFLYFAVIRILREIHSQWTICLDYDNLSGKSTHIHKYTQLFKTKNIRIVNWSIM